MTRFAVIAGLLLALLVGAELLTAQRMVGTGHTGRPNRWAQYEPEMQDPIDDPPDAWEKTEFAFARLRYRSPRDGYFRGRGRARWGTDSNKSERLFMQALRRLTRVHIRSIEEIVDVDSDEMFNWPFLYAVGVGDWSLSDTQAARLREYFLRGGFLMVDDFHNEREWASFMAGMHKVFPERDAVDIPPDDLSSMSPTTRGIRSTSRVTRSSAGRSGSAAASADIIARWSTTRAA